MPIGPDFEGLCWRLEVWARGAGLVLVARYDRRYKAHACGRWALRCQTQAALLSYTVLRVHTRPGAPDRVMYYGGPR